MLQEMSTTDERSVRSCTISAAGDFPHDLTTGREPATTEQVPELFTGKRRYDVTGDLACCDIQRKYEIKNNMSYCHEGHLPNLHWHYCISINCIEIQFRLFQAVHSVDERLIFSKNTSRRQVCLYSNHPHPQPPLRCVTLRCHPQGCPDTTAVNCTSPKGPRKNTGNLASLSLSKRFCETWGHSRQNYSGSRRCDFAFMIWKIPRAFPPMTYAVLPADVYGFFRSHNIYAFSTRRINVNK